MRIYIDVIYFLFFINRVSYYGNRFIIFVFDYTAVYNYYFLCNYFYHLYFIKIWNLIKIWIDSGLYEYFMGYTNTICNFVYCAQKNRTSIILQSHSANFTVVQRQLYSRTTNTFGSDGFTPDSGIRNESSRLIRSSASKTICSVITPMPS